MKQLHTGTECLHTISQTHKQRSGSHQQTHRHTHTRTGKWCKRVIFYVFFSCDMTLVGICCSLCSTPCGHMHDWHSMMPCAQHTDRLATFLSMSPQERIANTHCSECKRIHTQQLLQLRDLHPLPKIILEYRQVSCTWLLSSNPSSLQ